MKVNPPPEKIQDRFFSISNGDSQKWEKQFEVSILFNNYGELLGKCTGLNIIFGNHCTLIL